MQSEVVGFEFVKSQNSSFKFNENEISKTRSAQAESQPRYEVADVLNILGSKLENLAINSWQLRSLFALNPNSAIEKKEYFSILISNCVAVEKNKR